MILFLSNADTDILAVRSVLEGLPPDLGPVRAANPSHLPGPPAVEGVGVVLVRLLGGRSAWEDGFDELRYFERQDLRPNIKREPVTWRPNLNARANPMPSSSSRARGSRSDRGVPR